MKQTVSKSLIRRTAFLVAVLLVVFSVLAARILVIDTFGFEKYQQKVIEQMTTRSPAQASRGKIYDSTGKLLATSVTTYRVFISPSAISAAQKALDKRKSNSISVEIAEALSGLLDMDPALLLEKTAKSSRLDETVRKNVDEETAGKIRSLILDRGWSDLVFLEATDKRFYPEGSLASHVLGFAGIDGTGLYGLEYQYNEALSGTDGYYVTARDSRGNEMPDEYQSFVAAKDGYSLHLTLDGYIQSVLETQVENAVFDSGALNRGLGIAIDVKTGAILGMAVYPEFDLNDPWLLPDYYADKLAQCGLDAGSEAYEALGRQYLLETWSNKALTETYIPGSTFKILTSSMALEENLPILGSSVFCGGSKVVLGQTIHCHKRQGHGSLTFAEGIQHSCNVWFMTLGQALGTETFTDYFRKFGYREKTGIDLPGEGMGVISPRMTELDLAIYAFGQNFTVTAIQHLCAIAAVAGGGQYMKPYLVQSMTDKDGKTVWEHEPEVKYSVVSESTSKTLSEILAAGVAGEGGAKNAYVPGYRIAAKTGTSEKKGQASAEVERYVCSCVGYAPAEDPRVAVIIIVDEPTEGLLYGSTVAAPYIGNVMRDILPYCGVEPIYTEKEMAALASKINNYVGLPIENARAYAEDRGLTVEVVGQGAYVTSQTPNAQESYSGKTGKIVLYAGDEPVDATGRIPDVTGKSAREAGLILEESGFNFRYEGAYDPDGTGGTIVVSQSPKAGENAACGSVCTVVLRYMIGDE